MTKGHIKYRSGYKYQLADDYHLKTSIKPTGDIDQKFIALDKKGNLVVKNGYAWDGPSGPVFDSRTNLRASLVHDALYQLMRKKKLSRTKYKDKSDKLFQKICVQDGEAPATARFWYLGLKAFGKPASDPKNARKTKRAP